MYSAASCVRAKGMRAARYSVKFPCCRAPEPLPTGPLFTAFIGFTGPQAAAKSTATVAVFGLPPSLAAVNSSDAAAHATADRTTAHIPIRFIA